MRKEKCYDQEVLRAIFFVDFSSPVRTRQKEEISSLPSLQNNTEMRFNEVFKIGVKFVSKSISRIQKLVHERKKKQQKYTHKLTIDHITNRFIRFHSVILLSLPPLYRYHFNYCYCCHV